MKLNWFLFCFIVLLFSCTSHVKINQFTTVSSLIERGNAGNKASLVYLYAEGCPMCELFDYKILGNENVKGYINNRFLFYKIDINKNLFFSRLLFGHGAPKFLIVEGDKIKSLIAGQDSPEQFLYSLKNYKMEPLELSLSSFSTLKGIGTDISRTINELLAIIYHLEKKDWSNAEIIERLRKSVALYPCFYNRYLLMEMVKKEHPDEAAQIQKELLDEYTDPLTATLFAGELRHMLNECYHLDDNATAEIEFEHLKFDFGELKLNEVVTHKFPFKNTSAVPLLVYTVNASCGCTVSEWNQQPVLNGVADSIAIQYTATSTGKINKTVNVITNARKRNTLLTITATVK